MLTAVRETACNLPGVGDQNPPQRRRGPRHHWAIVDAVQNILTQLQMRRSSDWLTEQGVAMRHAICAAPPLVQRSPPEDGSERSCCLHEGSNIWQVSRRLEPVARKEAKSRHSACDRPAATTSLVQVREAPLPEHATDVLKSADADLNLASPTSILVSVVGRFRPRRVLIQRNRSRSGCGTRPGRGGQTQ